MIKKKTVIGLVLGITVILLLVMLGLVYVDNNLPWSYPESEKTDFLTMCKARSEVTPAFCDCMWKTIITKVSFEDWQKADKLYKETGELSKNLPDVMAACKGK